VREIERDVFEADHWDVRKKKGTKVTLRDTADERTMGLLAPICDSRKVKTG